MGKGTIKSGGTDGLYTIDVERNIDGVLERIRVFEDLIERITEDITAADEETDEAETDLDEANAALNVLLDDPESTQEAKVAQAKVVAEKAKDYRIAKRKADRLKLIKLSYEKQLLALQDVDETIEMSAWCADFTEDLTGEIATTEIPGQRTHVKVRPGYGGRATYSASRDGNLVPSQGQTKEGTAWNWAMRPGWQKWAPTYRGAVITALSGSLCSITIDDAESTDQELGVNATPTFADVPIEYMDCNGGAFAVDDHVLIEFVAQDRTNPKVIGFWDNPIPCTTGYFVFLPAADEAPSGWGEPFWTVADPPVAINPPLGTAGGVYSESVVKGSNTQVYVHLRKGDDYGGEFTQQLLRTVAYGFYDWHGDALGETLSINSTDGNRYWGFGSVRDTEIMYRGYTLCNSYNSQKVIGIAKAEFDSVTYLYAVFLKDDASDPIDETFEVWRRVWQEAAYANDNIYNVTTEPLGWEYLDDIDPPAYSGYVPASTGIPQMDNVSATDSGQCGGAAFAPDGESFMITYKLVDVGGSGTLFDQWIAGYIYVSITGTTGTTITPTMNWNPISQSAGWDYVIAVDYDKSGNLIKMLWEEEYVSGTGPYDIRTAFYISGGSFTERLTDYCPYTVSGRGYVPYYFALDLRTCSAVGQYYGYGSSGTDEEFGESLLDNEVTTATSLVTRGSAVTLITADGSFSGNTGYYAFIFTPHSIPFWGTRGFNGAAWDYHGNMLSGYNCDWVQIESIFAVGSGPPTSNGNRSALSGEPDLNTFLSIDGYTNPGIFFLGVI